MAGSSSTWANVIVCLRKSESLLPVSFSEYCIPISRIFFFLVGLFIFKVSLVSVEKAVRGTRESYFCWQVSKQLQQPHRRRIHECGMSGGPVIYFRATYNQKLGTGNFLTPLPWAHSPMLCWLLSSPVLLSPCSHFFYASPGRARFRTDCLFVGAHAVVLYLCSWFLFFFAYRRITLFYMMPSSFPPAVCSVYLSARVISQWRQKKLKWAVWIQRWNAGKRKKGQMDERCRQFAAHGWRHSDCWGSHVTRLKQPPFNVFYIYIFCFCPSTTRAPFSLPKEGSAVSSSIIGHHYGLRPRSASDE